jgi:alpha-1,6-mannosyltransferase
MIGSLLAGMVVILAYVPFFEGIETLQGMERGSIFSASPAELVLIGLQAIGWPLDRAMNTARLLASSAFGILTLVALLALWRGRLVLGSALAAIVLGYLLVGSQWFNPWYLLWLVPLAILAPDWRLRALTLVFALLAPLTYLLQYDARLVVPLVFGPVAALAVWWRASLGWTLGAGESPRVPKVAGRG